MDITKSHPIGPMKALLEGSGRPSGDAQSIG